ncbi:MAG: hypothetical protein WA323_06650 [Candidatus Nitrosopolaris sp.]
MIIFALNTPYIVNVTEVVNSNPAIIPASLQPVSSPNNNSTKNDKRIELLNRR